MKGGSVAETNDREAGTLSQVFVVAPPLSAVGPSSSPVENSSPSDYSAKHALRTGASRCARSMKTDRAKAGRSCSSGRGVDLLRPGSLIGCHYGRLHVQVHARSELHAQRGQGAE